MGLVGSWGGLRNFTGLNCLATGLCEPMGICDWVGHRSRIRGQPKTVTSLPERQSERAAGCWLTLCKYLVGHPGHPSSDTISVDHQITFPLMVRPSKSIPRICFISSLTGLRNKQNNLSFTSVLKAQSYDSYAFVVEV